MSSDRAEPPAAAEEPAKLRPEYTRGELRKATMAGNQAEAELIQGMLLEEGIPSTLRRMGGFDVPDFLAAGPRDVLVPESALAAAHELLTPIGQAPEQSLEIPREQRPAGLLPGFLVALAVAALLVYLLFEVIT